MAWEYYLYCTTYGNTLVCRSSTSFVPLPPNTGQILYDILIPETQPLYLYRESGATVIVNSIENVDAYLNATELPPTPSGNVTYGEFTGTTTALEMNKVNVSGDTMTGTLNTTANLNAAGMVSGSSVYSSVWIYSPIISGTTCVKSPIVIGGSCVCSPRILGSTSVCSPIISGSTCVTSPTVCTSSCLCSTGTARFTGAVVDSSSLSVSGATKLSSVGASQVVFGDNSTGALTGSTGMVYNTSTCTLCTNYLQLTGNASVLYTERLATVTNGTTTCAKYLGLTGTSMAAGCYSVDFTGTFGTSGSNGETLVQFTCDNVIVGGKETYFRMSTAKAVQTASTFRNLTLSAGTHCFDIWFRSCSSTACAEYGAIRIRRIC